MTPQPFSERPATGPLDTELDIRFLWQVVLRRRKIIGAVAALSLAAATITVFATRPEYEAKSMLLIEKVGTNALDREGMAVDSTQDDYYQTQYAILQSRFLLEQVMNDLRLAGQPDFAGADPVESLRQKVRIEPVRRTRLVNIIVSSRDPRLAATVANAIASRYIIQNLDAKMFPAQSLLKAMDGKNDRAMMESLPAVVNSELIGKLKGQLADSRAAWAEDSKRYWPTHPRMEMLAARIKATQNEIDREVRYIVESVRIQLAGEFKGNNIRVIDPARAPDAPARPRKTRTMGLALLLGAGLGFGLAFLIDRWDLTVRNQEDLESFVKVPCLAVLHTYTGFDGAHPHRFHGIWEQAHSPAAEAFRNLRTAVSFRLSTVKGPTIIQVTSAVQGEGKSFMSANLALAFATAGERVLLVDGDLRRPFIHNAFDLDIERGLSNYLSNGESTPNTAASGVANLTLLPCGPVPDKPAELLSDRKLKDFMAWAVGAYDRVIIDSPPVFPVTDSLLWARHAHGVLLVVRAGMARVAAVQRAHQKLNESFATVLGGIVNMAPEKTSDYYYYYSGYYRRTPEAAPESANPPSATRGGVAVRGHEPGA